MRQRSYTGSRWGCEAASFFDGRAHACYVRTTRAPLVSRSPYLTPTLLFPSSPPPHAVPAASSRATRAPPQPNPLVFLNTTLHRESCLAVAAAAATSTCVSLAADANQGHHATLPHDAACLRLRLRPRSTIFAAMKMHPLRSHCLLFLRMRNCACDSVLLLRLPQRAQQRCAAPTCPRSEHCF